MLGFKKKTPTPDVSLANPPYPTPTMPADGAMNATRETSANAQIPYEVYETLHEPTARRRRWVVRLVAALLAVTLLVFGGIALRDKLNDSQADSSTNNPGQQAVTPGTSPQGADTASQQPPQNNAPLQKPDSAPASNPQSSDTNTGTVNQPE